MVFGEFGATELNSGLFFFVNCSRVLLCCHEFQKRIDDSLVFGNMWWLKWGRRIVEIVPIKRNSIISTKTL